MYEGVYMEVINSDKFDEDTDISTTYLGKVDKTRDTEVQAEENFPMTARGYTRGHLLDGMDCDVLIPVQASHTCPNYFFCNASYCMQCPNLLPPCRESKLVMDGM